jgi:hypothetical protein
MLCLVINSSDGAKAKVIRGGGEQARHQKAAG